MVLSIIIEKIILFDIWRNSDGVIASELVLANLHK